jgi:prepilin-type N-terminal cleavage/methylation domain-containing protein
MSPTSRLLFRQTPTSGRRAFTLIELLVVLGIIGLLAAITLSVGSAVAAGQKKKATAETIRLLDMALAEYMTGGEEKPPPATIPHPDNPRYLQFIADAATPNGQIPTLAWFVYQIDQSGNTKAIANIQQINSKYVKAALRATPAAGTADMNATGAKTTTILDAWGNPIRYVHPANDGTYGPLQTADLAGRFDPATYTAYTTAQLQRSATATGNSDGGTCRARPYFYSCGPDGQPGTTEDNIYSDNKPTFQVN